MKKLKSSLLIPALAVLILNFFLISCVKKNESTVKKSLIAKGAKIEKCAAGFRFTEGPAADSKGNIAPDKK